jgi:hypothetical protein
MIDQLKSLGIEKGRPFSPDQQIAKLLDGAAQEAGALLEDMYDTGWPTFYENAQWRPAGPSEVVRMQATAYADTDTYPIDLRGMVYTYGYVGIKRLGVGQMYLISIRDREGESFDGKKTYLLKVPANAPVEQYWSVTAYDRQTHALIRIVPRASRSSQIPEMQKNKDGSIEVFFGPNPPAGKETNWVPTDPARKFELMFRAYAPTKAFFEKTWRLPDVERVTAAQAGLAA